MRVHLGGVLAHEEGLDEHDQNNSEENSNDTDEDQSGYLEVRVDDLSISSLDNDGFLFLGLFLNVEVLVFGLLLSGRVGRSVRVSA